MQSPDFEGIETYLSKDPALRKLYEEHHDLKKRIAKLEKKPYLTAGEQLEETRLKKLKLSGKDKIIQLLKRYKNG